MDADGAYAISGEGLPMRRLSHRAGTMLCRGLTRSLRIPQRIDGRAVLTVPMALAVNILNRMDEADRPSDLVTQIGDAHTLLLARGQSTSLRIVCGDLDHATDTDIEAPPEVGMDAVSSASDDPVLRRLMERHGISTIARTMPGIDAFWGGLEESQTSFGDANPYVRYTGLPDDFPAFMVRPACPGHESCVAVWFGYAADRSQGALYCQQGGSAWIGVGKDIPESVRAQLPGRPATDLVGHPALADWIIEDPFEGHRDDPPPTTYPLRLRA